MKKEYSDRLQISNANSKENQQFLKRLKKQNKRETDRQFHTLNDAVFEYTDCLDCANCCKTTSPIFTDQDIKRLSKLFKVKPADFIEEYLKLDEENDYVLKTAPCPFLQSDNTCFVYDVRPQACREYPHTDRKNMYQILSLTYRNSLMCPAVAEIVSRMKNEKK